MQAAAYSKIVRVPTLDVDGHTLKGKYSPGCNSAWVQSLDVRAPDGSLVTVSENFSTTDPVGRRYILSNNTVQVFSPNQDIALTASVTQNPLARASVGFSVNQFCTDFASTYDGASDKLTITGSTAPNGFGALSAVDTTAVFYSNWYPQPTGVTGTDRSSVTGRFVYEFGNLQDADPRLLHADVQFRQMRRSAGPHHYAGRVRQIALVIRGHQRTHQ